MGGVRCLGLFPKKSRFFFPPSHSALFLRPPLDVDGHRGITTADQEEEDSSDTNCELHFRSESTRLNPPF